MTNAGKRQAGITLVETLVAIAIMGVVASSTLVLIAQNTRFTSDARERMFASVAADNVMVETLLNTTDLSVGEEIGVARFRGYEWEFRRRITEVNIEGVWRIDIIVENADGQSIANITSLRGAQ